MLSSISPFGERSRNSPWWLTVTAYMAGSIAGGATTGLIAGAIGSLAFGWVGADTALIVIAVAAALGLAAEFRILGLRIPSITRQVNEDWLTTYRGWIYGVGFGYQLGLGWATIITTSTVWLTFIAAAMTGSILQGTLLGVIFGLARGAFIFATIRIDNPAALRQLFRTIAEQAPAVNTFARLAAALTAVTAIGGALT